MLPAVGHGHQRRVQRLAQLRDQRRQRVVEVAVLAATEAVSGHHDAAAEWRVLRVQGSKFAAGVRPQQPRDDGRTLRIQLGMHRGPVDCRYPQRQAIGGRLKSLVRLTRTHRCSSRASSARLRSTPQR